MGRFFRIVPLLLVGLLAHAGGRRLPPVPDVVPPPASVPSTIEGIDFKPVDYYTTKAQREVIKKAGSLAVSVMKSKCTADFLTARKLIQTEGRTNPQVVTHLQGLKDVVPVEMYYRRWGSAVAYRQPPEKTIHLNSRYFYVGMPLCEWAATLAHEGYGHAVGEYGHDYEWNSMRDFSVPYSLGGSSEKNKDVFQVCCQEPK